MSQWDPEYDLDEDDGDGMPPVEYCLICRQRGIWMRHVAAMTQGRRCVCTICNAIHVINTREGLTVFGFKEI